MQTELRALLSVAVVLDVKSLDFRINRQQRKRLARLAAPHLLGFLLLFFFELKLVAKK